MNPQTESLIGLASEEAFVLIGRKMLDDLRQTVPGRGRQRSKEAESVTVLLEL